MSSFIEDNAEAVSISPGSFAESLQRYKIFSLTTNEGIWDYNLETKQTYYNKSISLFSVTAKKTCMIIFRGGGITCILPIKKG